MAIDTENDLRSVGESLIGTVDPIPDSAAIDSLDIIHLGFVYREIIIVSGFVWDGGGVTNNWSEGANWASGVAPGSGDEAIFNATSTKDCTINTNTTVDLITVASGYTGTITMGAGITLTALGGDNSTDGLFMTGGAASFVGADGTVRIRNLSYAVGDSFTAPSGELWIDKNHTHNGTFVHNSGLVRPIMHASGNIWTGGAITLNQFQVFSTEGASTLTIEGETITVLGLFDIRSSPLSSTQFMAGGTGATIKIQGDVDDSGTKQMNYSGNLTMEFDGTVDQDVTGTARSVANLNGVVVNKASGTLTWHPIQTGFANGYTHSTGTVVGSPLQSYSGNNSVITPGPETITNIRFSVNNISFVGTLKASGDMEQVATGGSKTFAGGTIEIGGDLIFLTGATPTSGFGSSCTTILKFNGSGDSTIGAPSAGSHLTNTTTIAKTGSGKVLLSENTAPVTGGDIVINTGTLSFAGFDLTGVDALTVNAGGILEWQGNETVTANTTTRDAGATDRFTGDGDSLADTYDIPAIAYRTLDFNVTDGSLDKFRFDHTTTTTADTFTVSSASAGSLNICSTLAGTQAQFDTVNQAVVTDKVIVQDINSSGGPQVLAIGSTDGGNVTNWLFINPNPFPFDATFAAPEFEIQHRAHEHIIYHQPHEYEVSVAKQ